MKARDILQEKSKSLITIGPAGTLREASRCLYEHNIGALLVVDDGQSVGILSERDIVRQFAEHGAACETIAVEAAMTGDPVVGEMDDKVGDMAQIMTQRHIRHLPILDGDELVGLVSIRDVVEAQMRQSENQIRTLRSYMDSIP